MQTHGLGGGLILIIELKILGGKGIWEKVIEVINFIFEFEWLTYLGDLWIIFGL